MNSRRHDVRLLLLLLTLMPAPTNISFATATDLGATLPVTVTQQADDSGTTYTLWFKRTALAGETEWSVFPYGGGGSYTAQVTFWTDASTQYLFNDAIDRPSQIPVTPGTTYGIKISPPGGNPSPANLTLLVQLGADDALTLGQIAINDSTSGYPAVIMDPTTAEPVKFVPGFASGEGTAVLSSGTMAAIDVDADGVKIYNQALTLIATPTMPATGYTECLACNSADTFWVAKHDGHIISFDTAGTFGTPVSTGGGTEVVSTIAPLRDGSAVFYGRSLSTANSPVQKITVPGAVVTTFLAGVANYFFGANFLMLTNDQILIPYERAAFDSYIELRNTSTAALIRTYTLTGIQNQLERLFSDPADPTYFWIWYQDSTNNYFRKIKVSDGSIDHTAGPWPKFIEGDSQAAVSATPSAYFGADFSCVPWIIRGTVATTTYPIRRQRRFLLPSSESNYVMQIPIIELLMRTGIGLTPGPANDPPVLGSDPQVMIRLSKDGGKTWTPERWVSAGQIGRYKDRVRLTRATGNYRNAVLEVTVSDPVDWQFLAALAPNGIIEGSS